MNWFRRIFPVLLAIGVAASSGCVYWRLLKFKQQLQDFHANFEFRSDSTYSLVMKSPVVTGDDIDLIMKVNPTRAGAGSEGSWRIYDFEKQPPDSTGVLRYRFGFKGGLLTEVDFPVQFTSLYPGETLKELLLAAGGAEVDKKERAARVRALRGRLVSELPAYARIVEVLGRPSEREWDAETSREELVYRYRPVTASDGKQVDKRRAYGRFSFGRGRRLERVAAGIGSHEVSFDIPPPDGSGPPDRRR